MRLWPSLVLALVACGGGSSDTVDAPAPDSGYDTAKCLIKGLYGDLGTVTGVAGTSTDGSKTITVNLDPGPPGKDDFFLKLTAGKGVFAGGLAPGTFTITGPDGNFLTCGLCTNLIADIKPTTGPTKFYFADSGTVTLSSVAAPFSGSAQNLLFFEIDIMTGNKVPGGCMAKIDAVTFSTP
jgi:hypothetical protein